MRNRKKKSESNNKDSLSKIDNTLTEHEIQIINSSNGLNDKSDPTLNNDVDNVHTKHRIKIKSHNIESKYETKNTSRNKVDNNTMTNKCKQLIKNTIAD